MKGRKKKAQSQKTLISNLEAKPAELVQADNSADLSHDLFSRGRYLIPPFYRVTRDCSMLLLLGRGLHSMLFL